MGLCTKVCRKMERKMIADAKVWWIPKQSNMCRLCWFAATCRMGPHRHLKGCRCKRDCFALCAALCSILWILCQTWAFETCWSFEYLTRFCARQRRQRQLMWSKIAKAFLLSTFSSEPVLAMSFWSSLLSRLLTYRTWIWYVKSYIALLSQVDVECVDFRDRDY